MAKQEMDMQALRDFAAAWRRGERQEEANSVRAALEKQGKKALDLATQEPDLLLFLADQALISKGDIDKVLLEMDWTADPAVTGRLLAYRKNPPEGAPEPKEKKAPAPSPRDDWSTEKLPDGTLRLKSYKGKDTIVHIPSVLGKAAVTEIGEEALSIYASRVKEAQKSVRKAVREIHIQEGITSIGKGAFNGCEQLRVAEIPDSIKQIGFRSFGGCKKLAQIHIPAGITEISDDTFSRTALETVVIPKGVTRIGNAAFLWNGKLRSIEIPEGVLSIGSQAFAGCDSLTEVLIPDGVTEIGHGAFECCKQLRKVRIPASVKIIKEYYGRNIFYSCDNLTVCAPAGSYAERYAKENNIPFVAEE